MRSEMASVTDSKQITDRYTIIDRLGSGGAGVVHRARDEGSGRIVAFKQLLSAKAGKRAKSMEALFEREYRTLVRLKHPRIIEVYDYGVTTDGPFYTMELLEGSDLGKLKGLPYTDVCRHLRDVASSLALVHAQRLVHRDVSPGNIRITSDGTARLLDFGALASFGTNSEIIGTPPFMAPEVLQELPLDPRTDLYSLGAVGYYCLTGRPPFPARDVHDLPKLWQTPPPPPSALAKDIPEELDRLILSMLSQDPLGRPETAAAVIDQLTVIGRLPAEPHERAEQSYLLSGPLVGRATQTEWVLGRIEQALAGKGGEILIEGAAGIGKTRLANELCLAGTLRGTVTLRTDAESSHENFGVAIALGRRLLETVPEVAKRTAEPHLGVLRKLSPELAEGLGGAGSSTITSDPTEERMRSHAALREWFFAVARERTLLVSVDNVHAADEDSAAFLATLGRESRSSHLLLLTTMRSGSAVTAASTLRVLRERAQRLKLSSLDARSCEQLANGLFGGAANAGRVGILLCDRSGGVPQQFMELAQLMVQKKIAKYEAGSWVLPLDVAEDELPARSEEILSARLSELGPEATSLAETLAVHSGTVPLAVALAVSTLSGEGRTYTVLDELLAEQVLMNDADGYRFRHEGIREAVLMRMDPEARRACQLRAAEALLAYDESGVAERVQAALHLIDAGDEQRGTRILVTAAREFSAGAGMHQNPDALVRSLCRMVRTYDEQGRSDYALGALLFPLMPLAYYSANWQFMLEYGERAINIGLRITGLGRAGELVAELGPAEAMKQGLGAAAAAFAENAADSIGYDLKTAIAATIGMVPASVAVYASCLDSHAVSRISRAVKPLTFFGKEHVAYAMYLFAAAEAPLMEGRESASLPIWEAALAGYEAPACAAAIGESRARALRGGVTFSIGILGSYRFGTAALEAAAQMESVGVKTWAVSADQIRVLYHSFRGESPMAKHYADRIEANAVQGAQTWQSDLTIPVLLLNADVLSGDAMAARRRYVQLERRSHEAPSLKAHADAAQAAYVMLRGDVAEAISLYEKVLPNFPIQTRVGWETTRAYFARALNAAGEHERAKAVTQEVLSNMLPDDPEYVVHFLEAHRQHALAESGLGNHARAAEILDGLLAKHGHEDQPLLIGLLHQARAQVAQRMNDGARATKHRLETEGRFRATKNPVLVAQLERSSRSTTTLSAVRPTSERYEHITKTGFPVTAGVAPTLASPVTGASTLAEFLSTAAEPLEAALEFVIRQTKAKCAYLYVPREDELHLACSTSGDEAPETCVDELTRWVDVMRENDRGQSTHHGPSTHILDTVTVSGYRLVALRNLDHILIGGLVLESDVRLDLVDSNDLFLALSRIVEQHGADALGFITA